MGNPGQANYAAANACLDALARCRGAGGLAASSLQLPLVGGAGMGAAAFDERQMRYRGMAAISLEQYAACLGSVLARVVGVVGSPLPCGADQLRESVADPTQTRFVELMSPSAVAAPVAVAKVEGPLASALAALAASQRQPHVESLVVRVVRELTGSEASVTASTPLMEAGVDSLAATELSNRLRAATGLALSPTLVFEQPTPRAIAAHVLEQLAGAQPVVAPASLAAGSARAASGGTVCVRGAAGRWPGGCEGGAGALWPMLQASGDAVGAVPAARWTLSAVVDVGALSEVQAACVSHGGFVRDAERFDNAAFGVSAAESGAMDPQQRLLLETAYAALHASGARRSTLLGGEGGVFVGIERPDWALLASSRPSSVYAVTGDTISVASGRLSFALGLQGPCVSVDTACSSALVALHGAWRAVLSGECPEGAASAVSLKLTPQPTLAAAAAGMLSLDGRCKTWDARANGYVRSEGVGCTVVAPGGDGVVLLGLAVRQDGRSASLTAPNGSAQRTLLGAALASAGVAAAGVARLEAHGTGTALGDPTEAGSLAATLCGRASGRASPLAVAAAKASIGHSEPVSGQAGLQRLATALGRLAAGGNAQLRQLNPLVNERWKDAAAALSTQQVQAAVGGAGPVGGVSSFGYSGTIAHALLQCAPRVAASGVGGGAAVRFRRRAFTWATGAADARDSSAVALYSVGWAELAAAGAPTASSRGGQWLAVQPAGALGVAALSMLAAVPASVRLVSEPLGSACIGRSLRGVALLLDAADGVAPCVRGVQSAVRLAQLLCRTAPPPPLVLLTSGAVAVRCGAGAAALSGAAHGGSWGFARVLRLEQPAARVLSADVSRDACAAAAVGSLLSEAASSVVVGGAESEVAWAGGLRHGARLRRRGLEAATASGGTASGAWLVTGGLGGLGLRGAALLASRGASRLVLTSRSGLVARGGQGLEASLRAVGVSGGSTTVVACDGGDAAEAAALVALVRPTGVLHAAGVLSDRLLQRLSASHVASPLQPKAGGAVRLHSATALGCVEALVLFSSVASTVGNPGQGNYAAANACLDALSRCRGAGGLAASSLQLPLVGGAGMGQATMDALRMDDAWSLGLEQYAACLGSVLHGCGAVWSPLPLLPVHLGSVVPSGGAGVLFGELATSVPEQGPAVALEVSPASRELADTLAALAASQRQPHVESLVVRVVRELTGSEASVTASTPLMEAGVDSLAATELSNRLRAATGLALSPTLVFEQPTPRAIAAHVLEQLAGAQPVVAPASLAAGSARAASGGTVCVRGAAGRWPGGCEGGAGALWPMLQASGDAVGAVPAARWTLSAVVDVGALSEVQAACVLHGGFVRDAERFDNTAFGVSAAESGAMDPQQRLLLETAYAALHASGARRSTLLGGEGGVFVGIERPDWALLASSRPSSVYAVTGDTTSVASGRLSFALGLQGPCVSVDTACSSALVALHGAWRAVLGGECPEGAASAVSLKLSPQVTLAAAAAGMLSSGWPMQDLGRACQRLRAERGRGLHGGRAGR